MWQRTTASSTMALAALAGHACATSMARQFFFLNHHGPLQVNTGGECGGEATAYNMLKVIGLHAQNSDVKILLGDLNADNNSATQKVLKRHLYQIARDWVDAIYSSCKSDSWKNLGNGGSDHNAIE